MTELYIILGVFGFFALLIILFLIYLFTFKYKYRFKPANPKIEDLKEHKQTKIIKETVKENKHINFKLCLKIISIISLFLALSSISLFVYSLLYLNQPILILSFVAFPVFTTLFYVTK